MNMPTKVSIRLMSGGVVVLVEDQMKFWLHGNWEQDAILNLSAEDRKVLFENLIGGTPTCAYTNDFFFLFDGRKFIIRHTKNDNEFEMPLTEHERTLIANIINTL